MGFLIIGYIAAPNTKGYQNGTLILGTTPMFCGYYQVGVWPFPGRAAIAVGDSKSFCSSQLQVGSLQMGSLNYF